MRRTRDRFALRFDGPEYRIFWDSVLAGFVVEFADGETRGSYFTIEYAHARAQTMLAGSRTLDPTS